jgi:hypothetical protein
LFGADAEEEVDEDEAVADAPPFVARLFCRCFFICALFRLEEVAGVSSGHSSGSSHSPSPSSVVLPSTLAAATGSAALRCNRVVASRAPSAKVAVLALVTGLVHASGAGVPTEADMNTEKKKDISILEFETTENKTHYLG